MAAPHNIGLFVTCLVDLYRPSVAFSTIKLLEKAGCKVNVPASQTCCGQPAFNSGDTKSAISIAQTTIASFESFDYVVVPSGSCAGMLKKHYPDLFVNDPDWQARATTLASKVYELTTYLADVLQQQLDKTTFNKTVTFQLYEFNSEWCFFNN